MSSPAHPTCSSLGEFHCTRSEGEASPASEEAFLLLGRSRGEDEPMRADAQVEVLQSGERKLLRAKNLHRSDGDGGAKAFKVTRGAGPRDRT